MEGKRLGDAKSSPKVSPGGRGGARTETGILTPGPVLSPRSTQLLAPKWEWSCLPKEGLSPPTHHRGPWGKLQDWAFCADPSSAPHLPPWQPYVVTAGHLLLGSSWEPSTVLKLSRHLIPRQDSEAGPAVSPSLEKKPRQAGWQRWDLSKICLMGKPEPCLQKPAASLSG